MTHAIDGRPSCYVSYSHGDVDRESLDELVKWLKRESGRRIDYFYDGDVRAGRNLDDFMGLLYQVDAVIIVMTPDYKNKVTNRQRGGVYTEFRYILDRYKRVDDAKRDSQPYDDFALIPVLFSGTHATAVPDDIAALKYETLLDFKAVSFQGETRVPRDVVRKYEALIRNIIADVVTVNSQRAPGYQTNYDSLFSFLFSELKADWQTGSSDVVNEKTLRHLFVKTYAYKKTLQQNGYFLVGRKGSGKSTVAGSLSFMHPQRYKGVVGIVVNDINLEMAYGFLTPDAIRSDLQNVFNRLTVFKFAWDLLLHLGTMEILLRERAEGHLNEYQHAQTPPISAFMEREFPLTGSVNRVSVFHDYALQRAVAFADHCVAFARPDEKHFIADITARFNVEEFLTFALGAIVKDSTRRLLDVCRRRVLVSLDGFDTAFDEFRKISVGQYPADARLDRSRFEIDWLRSLLHLVVEIKQNHASDNALYRILDFCLTVPKDRYMEIEAIERDAYLYRNRCVQLNWSGIELAILIRKRLDTLYNHAGDKRDRPVNRLRAVMAIPELANIPDTVSCTVGGKTYELPLFIYLLRHTFWRPRDILYYYARILAVAKDMRDRKHDMTSDVVRRIVKDTTYDIINQEFINEFQSSISNIRQVIETFRGMPQILSHDDVVTTLNKVEFADASGSGNPRDASVKIRFLYDIGFLGFEVDERIRNRFSIRANQAFYFNEGDMPLRILTSPMLGACRLVIHPVFVEYLQLDTSRQNLTLNLDWDYLREMEALLHV